MNHITVWAHGQPGSLVRRAQEDPTFVPKLYRESLKALIAIGEVLGTHPLAEFAFPGLVEARNGLRAACEEVGRSVAAARKETGNPSDGVAETTLGVSGAEPRETATFVGNELSNRPANDAARRMRESLQDSAKSRHPTIIPRVDVKA